MKLRRSKICTISWNLNFTHLILVLRLSLCWIEFPNLVVSRIYQTVRIKYLAQLVPFFDFSAVEKISIDAVKNNFVAMKVDHVKGVLTFDMGTESDGMRDPLTIFAETMNKVKAMLFPALSKTSKIGEIVPNIRETVEKEHIRLLDRKSIIEKRKEEQERQQLEMDCEEEQRRVKLLKLTEEAEQKRLATEFEERRKQRILRDIEERELEEAQEKVTKETVMERVMSEKRKVDEQMEKKREVELSMERHESDLIEKNRLARMLKEKVIHEERVISFQQAKFDSLRREKEGQIIRARKQERNVKRKQIYYLKSEEERITKLQEEEEARKNEDATDPLQSPAKYIPPRLRRSQATEVSGSRSFSSRTSQR